MQRELVERVLALTQDIGYAAALADWQGAARLTEECSPLLMSIAAEQEPSTLAVIRQIQAINADILEEAQTASAEMQVEFADAIARIKAVSRYHSVAKM